MLRKTYERKMAQFDSRTHILMEVTNVHISPNDDLNYSTAGTTDHPGDTTKNENYELSDYEKMRLERIQRNRNRLISLGLHESSFMSEKKSRNIKRTTNERELSSYSSRKYDLRKLKVVTFNDNDIDSIGNDNDDDSFSDESVYTNKSQSSDESIDADISNGVER